jgi:hypothetical protein
MRRGRGSMSRDLSVCPEGAEPKRAFRSFGPSQAWYACRKVVRARQLARCRVFGRNFAQPLAAHFPPDRAAEWNIRSDPTLALFQNRFLQSAAKSPWR